MAPLIENLICEYAIMLWHSYMGTKVIKILHDITTNPHVNLTYNNFASRTHPRTHKQRRTPTFYLI